MESIVSTGIVSLGLVILAMSGLHRLSTLAAVMLVGGAAWVIFISLINALVQNLAPDWVRARVLAIFILVYQGSYALGTATWDAVAQRSGVGTALVYAGLGTIATAAVLSDLDLNVEPCSRNLGGTVRATVSMRLRCAGCHAGAKLKQLKCTL